MLWYYTVVVTADLLIYLLAFSSSSYVLLLPAEHRAVLSYSARRYDSAICCSKMSRDAFLSEMYVFVLLFCLVRALKASIFVYVCFVDCCIAASLQTVRQVCSKTVKG